MSTAPPGLLKLNSGILRRALVPAVDAVPEPVFVLSASEFSYYSSARSVSAWCELKPQGGDDDDDDTVSPNITTMQFAVPDIIEFLESQSDDDDTVIIKLKLDEDEETVIEFQIENKPGKKYEDLYINYVNFEGRITQAAKPDYYDATVTLSTDLFIYVITTIAKRPEKHLGDEHLDKSPHAARYDVVRITLSSKGVKFSSKGYSLLYKVDEVEDLKVKRPVSFAIDNFLLRSFHMVSMDATSVTISARPRSPLLLEFDIGGEEAICYRLEDRVVMVEEALSYIDDDDDDDDDGGGVVKKRKDEVTKKKKKKKRTQEEDEVNNNVDRTKKRVDQKKAGPPVDDDEGFDFRGAIRKLLTQQTQILKEVAELRSIVLSSRQDT